MYSEKLEKLIAMALLDGELSEKEKQILFKNAEKEGIDLDEFEMVLEAKLFENNKSDKPVTVAPKSDKFGEVKKCPACGSMVQSFQIKCIDCGHEFSNVQSNASVNRLFEMLNEAESERKDEGMSVAKALGGMFSAYGLGVDNRIDSKKKTIISNFPIPTTKDDIVEFLSLAVPRAKSVGNIFTRKEPENKSHNDFVNVWKAKCEQIIMKAKFSMKEDKRALEEIMLYAKELKIK
ncbi:hypothetical protein [Gelidibacter gilvus]|uniref:Uncharacterized protein n=1 Tax=Gelidibacter gilvus TaxID=59602 RepID=A0A4Q0XJ05_9FLAO|nr:hypothetical protein [Gelidibacter gilvus]RXJ51103.1 hypothetical protein ESZ48_04295 [Gelidibacter gilvus]